MSDEQNMPDDLVKVNTVGWDADAMQEHVFDCHDAIRTLTAERDAQDAKVRELVEAVDEDEIEVLFYGTDKVYSGEKYAAISISNLQHIQTLAAQLKEQDDAAKD